jgi:hypothetical protein
VECAVANSAARALHAPVALVSFLCCLLESGKQLLRMSDVLARARMKRSWLPCCCVIEKAPAVMGPGQGMSCSV